MNTAGLYWLYLFDSQLAMAVGKIGMGKVTDTDNEVIGGGTKGKGTVKPFCSVTEQLFLNWQLALI